MSEPILLVFALARCWHDYANVITLIKCEMMSFPTAICGECNITLLQLELNASNNSERTAPCAILNSHKRKICTGIRQLTSNGLIHNMTQTDTLN